VVHVDLDAERTAADGFERSARPLWLGPVVEVDTTRPVDIKALAGRVRGLLRVPATRAHAGVLAADGQL
jgi:hypothetical protein